MNPSPLVSNVEPPADLSPFEQLIIGAALALARCGRRITADAIAEAVGLPPAWVRLMWRVRAPEGGDDGHA